MQDLIDPPVIISADAKAHHQAVIKVMDAARQLGLVKMTFATQKSGRGISSIVLAHLNNGTSVFCAFNLV